MSPPKPPGLKNNEIKIKKMPRALPISGAFLMRAKHVRELGGGNRQMKARVSALRRIIGESVNPDPLH
jgi:hypothetical protein